MNQCIINEKEGACPHKELSGKLCSACKIPDIERERVQWYHYFCLNVPHFKQLGLDEQAHLVLECIKIYREYSETINKFNELSYDKRKEHVISSLTKHYNVVYKA